MHQASVACHSIKQKKQKNKKKKYILIIYQKLDMKLDGIFEELERKKLQCPFLLSQPFRDENQQIELSPATHITRLLQGGCPMRLSAATLFDIFQTPLNDDEMEKGRRVSAL